MDFRTPRDVGREFCSYRHFLRLKQSEVARACGVSRQWISSLESGKATLEIGLVLRAYETLGLDLKVTRADEPPRWTKPITIHAEMRDWQSIRARRMRRLREAARERDIRSGNLKV